MLLGKTNPMQRLRAQRFSGQGPLFALRRRGFLLPAGRSGLCMNWPKPATPPALMVSRDELAIRERLD